MLIISCSLNERSRSRVLAKAALENSTAEFLDLRDYPLPLCDGSKAYEHKNVVKLNAIFSKYKKFLIATPVYNYDVNAALKNLLELTGDNWKGKLVGIMCAAGGKSSYMAPMSFLNSLMLDFRCWVVPKYLYADSSNFNEERNRITNSEIVKRIQELIKTIQEFSPKTIKT
jgi:NAD(P)H-dependent FMN reductase